MRQQVSEDELLAILNEELSKCEGCKWCRFDNPPMKLAHPDEDGCNWSTVNIRCSGVPVKICQPFVERIVSDARRKYNLK